MHLRSPFPPIPPHAPTNYHHLLFPPAPAHPVPDHVVHVDALTGESRTRSHFLERTYDAATALGAPRHRGALALSPRDVVAIVSDNSLDYIVLVHALLVLTTPFALLSTYATPPEFAHALDKSRATHLFVHPALLPRFLPVARERAFPLHRVYLLDAAHPSPHPSGLPRLGDMIQHVRATGIPREPVRHAARDTLAYLVFSSGTSGLPKVVMISHGNLAFTLFQAAVILQEHVKIANVNPAPDPNAVQVILGFLPMFHSYGLHFTCLRWPSWKPTTVVVLPRWDMKAALSAIPKYRVNVFPGIPSIIQQLLNAPEFHTTDLSSINAFGSGAAHLPPRLVQRLREMLPGHVDVSEGYGMSEATLSVIGRPREGLLGGRVECVPTASGILLPGMEAVLLRPDGTHCLPNEPGELYIKGGNVALGYWKDARATREAFVGEGWVRTGDRFRVNERGTFWFEDRAKDTLKVSGLQVSPAEIEDVLLSEPSGDIADVAVAGVRVRREDAAAAHDDDELRPRAWIVLSARGRREGERVVRERAEGWVRERLSRYKWLRGGVEVVEEIPKNATGKTLRRVLQERYAAEVARAKL